MMSQEDTGVTQQGLLQEATTKHFHMSKEVKKQDLWGCYGNKQSLYRYFSHHPILFTEGFQWWLSQKKKKKKTINKGQLRLCPEGKKK